MWGWGAAGGSAYSGVLGYCGETSIQSAGLYYGNWLHTQSVFAAGATPDADATTLYGGVSFAFFFSFGFGFWAWTTHIFRTRSGNDPRYKNYGARADPQPNKVPGYTVNVGQNFNSAAAALGLSATKYATDQCGTATDFLNNYVKPNIDNGFPVVLGFLDPNLPQQYDHIQPIVGMWQLLCGWVGVVRV